MPRAEKDYEELHHLSNEAKDRLRVADKGRGGAPSSDAQDEPKKVSTRLGARDQGKEYGKALGVVILDADGDGRPDIYVANDTVDNFLYLNQSRPGEILLDEVGVMRGVAMDGEGRSNGSMGRGPRPQRLALDLRH